MGKKEMLDELDELLNIPQAERILFHKVKELKTLLRDEISLYRDLKDGFRSTAYGKMHIYEEKEQKKLPTHRFQLDKDEHEKWKITDIDPSPHAGIEAGEIVPPLIVKYMDSFSADATKIETVPDFSHPDLGDRAFLLRFAKYSDRHIMGTIAETQPKKEGPPAEPEAGKVVDINDYYNKDKTRFNYRELMSYMERFPALRDHIFAEFLMRWKPLIDKNLLKLKQSSGTRNRRPTWLT